MQNVTKSQLKKWMDGMEDMVLIDVLPREYFEKRHLPAAISIPLKDTPHFAETVEKNGVMEDQRIVLYCANPQCPLSKEAAKKLEDAGFTNVYVFEEGVEGWFGAGAQEAAA